MKLRKLLKDIKDIEVKGPRDIEITGLSSNSKTTAPGDLFIAKKGKSYDGNQYIPEAIESGAIAVLTDFFDPFQKGITQIINHDIQTLEAILAHTFYEAPSHELLMIGLTGTNGKTTASYIVKYVLDALQKPCGLIGTIETIIGDHRQESTHTTPDVTTNHKNLRDMLRNKDTAAVMEVSSHALDQDRVSKILYDIAIFTNLSQDHLDYHENMNSYASAKAKLFSTLELEQKKHTVKFPPTAIVNADCKWSEVILKNNNTARLSYGFSSEADLRVDQVKPHIDKTEFCVEYQGSRCSFCIPLLGRYNISNSLAAIACGLLLGASLEKLSQIMETFPGVPGRLQSVHNDLDICVVIDYAHTPDALENVLLSLQELKKRKLITVFGCGGDRDKGKRKEMGTIAQSYSDHIFITSDNPRTEDPESICKDILADISSDKAVTIDLNRRSAIHQAISKATKGDIVLIAGKGHETHQILGRKTIPFNDKEVASEMCIQKYHEETPSSLNLIP